MTSSVSRRMSWIATTDGPAPPSDDRARTVRPGVYVFNDAQQLELGTCDWSGIALTVAARVVSRREDRSTLR